MKILADLSPQTYRLERWTVEMFLMYCLERSDILPADDFSVREGYRQRA